MSKKNENGSLGAPDAQDTPQFLAVEEHAGNLKVAAPVFAAVMQSQGWAPGKKVDQTEFKAAVNAFLGAPMGGN